MMNDDKLDETIAALAREHNRAPATPRAEMWAAIAAARDSARREAVAPVVLAPPTVVPMRRSRVVWRWAAVGGALAATLLIGFELGQRTRTADDRGGSRVADGRQGAAAETPVTPGTTTVASTNGSAGAGSTASSESTGSGQGPARPVERSTARLASAPRGADTEVVRSGAASRSRRDAALPYRVAAMEHLVTTEALLVSLRSDVRSGRRDTTIAGWAGDLLGTTRMLMDSPAAKDAQLKQLLEDLELVLAQIARLPGAHGEAADLGLIDDAVQRRQIMTRLRAITPGT